MAQRNHLNLVTVLDSLNPFVLLKSGKVIHIQGFSGLESIVLSKGPERVDYWPRLAILEISW